METAVFQRLATLVSDAGFGKLVEDVEEPSYHGRLRAVLVMATTEGEPLRRRVTREKVDAGRSYLEQVESDQLRVDLKLLAPTRAELMTARQVIRLGLVDGLADSAGHHVTYLGEQTVWPVTTSKLVGERGCVMFLHFEGGLYREVVVATAKRARISPAPEAP
jgi:hypothetical protein